MLQKFLKFDSLGTVKQLAAGALFMARDSDQRLRVAIIGGGISGNICGYLLHDSHDVTLFTADSHNGGHTHTHCIEFENRKLHVDTGFMVYNQRTYPFFVKLLERLGIRSKKSDMSFSVRCERSNLEYSGSSVNGLFAQRSNVLRPAFYRMLLDILRFNREAPRALELCSDSLTLQSYLSKNRYSDYFIQNYLVPLGASIWSARADRFLAFPLKFLIAFLDNHGLLQVRNRPQWYTIEGGAQRYVEVMTQGFKNSIRLDCPVERVDRSSDSVKLHTRSGAALEFDRVIFATHADTTLALLSKPTPKETEILSQFEFQQNKAILHTDQRLLPKSRRAWASWNYHVSDESAAPASVTYDVNRLQSHGCSQPICVTLNPTHEIDEHHVIKKMLYRHPVFSTGTITTQNRQQEINGENNSFFCGAYWGFGFHEDGLRSGLAVAKCFGKEL